MQTVQPRKREGRKCARHGSAAERLSAVSSGRTGAVSNAAVFTPAANALSLPRLGEGVPAAWRAPNRSGIAFAEAAANMGLVKKVESDITGTVIGAFKALFARQEFALSMTFELYDSFPEGDDNIEAILSNQPELAGKQIGALALVSNEGRWWTLKNGLFGSLPPAVGARILTAITNGLNCFCHCITPKSLSWEAERLWWQGDGDETEAVNESLNQLREVRPDATAEDAILEYGIVTKRAFEDAFAPHVLYPHKFTESLIDREWTESLTRVQRFGELPNIMQMTETLERMVAAQEKLNLKSYHLCSQENSSTLSHPVVIHWDEDDWAVKITDELNELDQQSCSRMDMCGLWPFDASDATQIENTALSMIDKIRCANVALKLLALVGKQENRHRS